MKFLFFLPLVLYSIAIFYMSNQPGDSLPSVVFGRDKFLHAIAYFVYCLNVQFALIGYFDKISRKKVLLYSLLISVIYGLSDEFHQFFVPGRDSSPGDILANIVGALMGLTLVNFMIKKIRKFKKGKEIEK